MGERVFLTEKKITHLSFNCIFTSHHAFISSAAVSYLCSACSGRIHSYICLPTASPFIRGLEGRLEPPVVLRVRLLSLWPLLQDELIESEFTSSVQMLLGGKTQSVGAGVSVLTLISIKDLHCGARPRGRRADLSL